MTQHATRITAIRHGETDWNVATRIQGQLDIGLNRSGRWQAERVAEALADEHFDAVYSSDLARAQDTALGLTRNAGLELRSDRGLRERGFGAFEGLTYTEIEQRFPGQALRWRQRDAGFGAPGGETLQDFRDRVLSTVAALAARHRGQHIALVTHGGVLDVLYRAGSRLALDAPRTWSIGNASINRLLHGEQGFSLVGWSDNCHLEDPSLEEGTA